MAKKEKTEEELKKEFRDLLNAFLSKTPSGEEILAREADVSRPTVTRWKNEITFPSRVARRMVIDCLKILLNKEIEIDEDRFVYAGVGRGRKKHIFPKRILKAALCLRGPASNKKCDSLRSCKECENEYIIVSRSPSFSMFIG